MPIHRDGARAVSRPVEVDEKAERVPLPARILAELRHHARDTLPDECCGLIIGDENDRYQRVVRCHNDMTQRHNEDGQAFPRDASSAFWMRETDYQKAVEAADQQGQRVTAVYHSHVSVRAYLSQEDLRYVEQELFPFPDADQIVVGVPLESTQPAPDVPVEIDRRDDSRELKRFDLSDLKFEVAVFRRAAPDAPFRGHPSREQGA